MIANNNCGCCAAPKLIFPCSGVADVGALADQSARKMTRKGIGKMYCLAGIGGRVKNILEKTKTAQEILAIDGCSNNVQKILWRKPVSTILNILH